jgi:phage terminase large subunit-like protein
VGFNAKKADDAVKFYKTFLTHTKGKWARQPFILPPWQEKIIREVFGTVKPNGLRQYSTCYIEIPKKNGKTEIAAGVALTVLSLDEEPGCEVYSAASTRDQASICFRVAAQMVRQNSDLLDTFEIHRSTKTLSVKDDPECFYRAISADADIQDGINPQAAVFDELHRQKNRDLWDVIKFGMDTREQPLLFGITTAGIVGESPLCEELHDYALQVLKGTFKDPSFYAVIYGLDQKEDWTFEGEPERRRGKIVLAPATGWYKANPALGNFLSLSRVRQACEEAKRIPAKQNAFRRLRLNQWTNQASVWIPHREWQPCGEPFDTNQLAGKTCYAGLDLSTNLDITAFIKVFPEEEWFKVLCDFWLPEEDLHERALHDMVPYDVWVAQGFVRLTPGNVIDYDFIEDVIKKQSDIYEIKEIGYDRWNASAIVTRLIDYGLKMVPIAQGFASLSSPSKELQRLVMTRLLRHGGNPVLAWMADCCSVKQDFKDNILPVKPDRKKSSKRIDGVVALIMALDRAIRNEGQRGAYDSQDLKVI